MKERRGIIPTRWRAKGRTHEQEHAAMAIGRAMVDAGPKGGADLCTPFSLCASHFWADTRE
eukprot:4684877-Pyramimonas_sp.AAC.1